MDVSRLRFLVVDDSHMIRKVIASLLRELGAEFVDTVADGKAGLEQIRKADKSGWPYSLITLDWEMPVMPGLELLKEVRACPKLKNLPVLMVSTKADPASLEEVAPYLPNGFIVKPFTAEMLKERVLALLQETQKG